MSDDEGASEAEAEATAESEDAAPPIGEDLTDRVAEHDEELAGEVELLVEKALELKERIDEQAEDIEDLKGRLKRKQADFQNYKKRQDREKERIRKHATEDLVERLLDVRDNLKRAVAQDHDDVESIREGIKMTLREFDRVLDAENVTEIDPDPGDEVDPNRHAVMMRVEDDAPSDEIVDVYAPGYEMADKVLQAAQVTVGQGDPEADEGAGGAETGSESDDAEQSAASPDGASADGEAGAEGDAAADGATDESAASEPDGSEGDRPEGSDAVDLDVEIQASDDDVESAAPEGGDDVFQGPDPVPADGDGSADADATGEDDGAEPIPADPVDEDAGEGEESGGVPEAAGESTDSEESPSDDETSQAQG